VYPDFATSTDGINFDAYTTPLPIGAAGADLRTTQDGEIRITQDGGVRIPE
jgi:hypothetical protein